MAEIELSRKALAMIRQAIDDGVKSLRINDLFINIEGEKITVINIHTGQEFEIINAVE